MSSDDISREDFAVLVARTGLTLSPEQVERMRISYKHIKRLADLVRHPDLRGVEGAHLFVSPRPPAEGAVVEDPSTKAAPGQPGTER